MLGAIPRDGERFDDRVEVFRRSAKALVAPDSFAFCRIAPIHADN